MRLVQRTMLPESRPSDLVELVGSGLLHRVGPEPGPGADARDEVVFDFAPGVRDELLAGGRRSDTTRVLTTVARHLGDRIAGLRDLAGLVTAPERAEMPELTAELVPFALPVLHVFRALAGPYLRPRRRWTPNSTAKLTLSMNESRLEPCEMREGLAPCNRWTSPLSMRSPDLRTLSRPPTLESV
ncbi:hypothetical protein ACFQY7_03950 [Actinomadura luteofluorescens]|uniref:hypothetical protein n=1 Tax=Actinomadura luteofluorescens TaxID=46163 RepID=UPI00363088C1